MKARLAIYDMDRTVTRRPTYTPFLIHAALRLAPWRLAPASLRLLAMLAYALKLIDRGRLKEINYRLLIGRGSRRSGSSRWSRASPSASSRPTSCPAPARSIAADKAAGRRLVLATASYRLYAAAIARRLGFDDVIATDTRLDARGRSSPGSTAAIATASPSST
jgi:phosphoserine phosphatase